MLSSKDDHSRLVGIQGILRSQEVCPPHEISPTVNCDHFGYASLLYALPVVQRVSQQIIVMTGVPDELVDIPSYLQKTYDIADKGEGTAAGRGGLPKPDSDLTGTFVNGPHLADPIAPLIVGSIFVDTNSINPKYQVIRAMPQLFERVKEVLGDKKTAVVYGYLMMLREAAPSV